MKYSISINYPEEEIPKNRLRFKAYMDYKYFDRPPVFMGVFTRYFLDIFGIDYNEYFKDAETQYYWQLQFQKWAIENIPDDRCQGNFITVAPDFENIHNSAAFGGEIIWSKDNPPRIHPVIHTLEDVDKFRIPDITEGFWAKLGNWWQTMMDLAKETKVTFNGKPGKVEVAPLSVQMIGPLMIAIELVGDKFYEWMALYPDVCHKLLKKITHGLIHAEDSYREVDNRLRQIYGLAEDDGCNISNEMFREFCVPYDNMLYDYYGKGLRDGRSMHMCGRSDHLHRTLVDELKISTFSLFGCSVRPSVAAKNLAGKCYLWGNIDPILLYKGSKEDIKGYIHEYLEAVAPLGGIMLGDGANVVPGTSIESLGLVREAAEEYAEGHPNLFTNDTNKFEKEESVEIGASGKSFVI